jgi:hypothetical protein
MHRHLHTQNNELHHADVAHDRRKPVSPSISRCCTARTWRLRPVVLLITHRCGPDTQHRLLRSWDV